VLLLASALGDCVDDPEAGGAGLAARLAVCPCDADSEMLSEGVTLAVPEALVGESV
jgi:hypothetical protein